MVMENDVLEMQIQVLIVCGVSGSGKSTVGQRVADHLGWRFIEGDDFHSLENVEKMRRGEPLDDRDREPWLQQLQDEIKTCLELGTSAVLACSALRKNYRQPLCLDPQRVRFVFLMGDIALLENRLMKRQNHFMEASLLHSQVDILELSDQEFVVDIDQSVDQMVVSIADWINQ